MRLGLYTAGLAAVLLACAFAFAQDEPQKEPTDQDRLEAAISELEMQIKQENSQFEVEKDALSAEIERLRAQRDGLLLSIESLNKDIRRVADSNTAERASIEVVMAEIKTDRALFGEVGEFLGAAVLELRDLADESLEGTDSQALVKEAADLAESLDGEDAEPVESARRFFEIAGRLLARSNRVETYDSKILTAGGVVADAQFLRVGEVTSLYLTSDGIEAGVLFRSPVDESVRRHERFRGGEVLRAVKETLASAKARTSEPVYVPMDISQDMEVGVSYGEDGLAAYLARGGPVMIPLLIVAALAAALIIERLFALQREGAGTLKYAREIVEAYRTKGLQSALTLAKGGRGAVGRVLRAGLEKTSEPADVFEETLHEASLAELPKLERFLSTIAVLATVAPLLGLLGTVTGMISAFDTIAAYGTSDPRLLSGGISEALITTEIGLIIAIPVLLMHGFLSAKVDRITANLEQASSELMAAAAAGPPAPEPQPEGPQEAAGGDDA